MVGTVAVANIVLSILVATTKSEKEKAMIIKDDCFKKNTFESFIF